MLKHYTEKIEHKVDIFHYLKALGKLRGMTDMLIRHEDERLCFNTLTEYLYTIKVNNDYDCKNIKKADSFKKKRIHSFLSKQEDKTDNGFILEKLKELM